MRAPNPFRFRNNPETAAASQARSFLHHFTPYRSITLTALCVAFIAVVLWITPLVHAASFSSVQSGNWDDPATWGGSGFPVSGDSATINAGHTVTVNGAQGVSSLTVSGGAALTASLGGTLSVDTGSFSNFGTINGPGTINTIGNTNFDQRGSFTAALLVSSNGGNSTSVHDDSDGSAVVDGPITVASAATLQVINSHTLVANGDLTINSTGTLTGSDLLRFDGNTLTNNGTISVNNVEFDKNGAQTIAGNGVWNGSSISIGQNGSGHFSNTSLAGPQNFAISGTLAINTGSTLTVNNTLTLGTANLANRGTIAISDVFHYNPALSNVRQFLNTGSMSGAGTFDAQGDIDFDQRGPFAATLSLLISSSSGRITRIHDDSDGSAVVDGPITVASGATLQVTNSHTLFANSDLTINSTGTLTGSDRLVFDGSTLTNNGNISVNNVEFNGATQTLTGTGAFISNLASVLNGSTLTLGSDHQMSRVTINGGGSLDISGHTLGVSGSGTPITDNGTFITTGSTVVYNGGAAQDAQTVNANWDYFNLTIDNSAGVSLSTSEVIPGTLTLTNGVFSNGSNLTLGDGSLISRSNGSLASVPTFAGVVNVRYTEISPPTPITTGPELPTSTSVLKDLTVNNSGGVSLNADATVNNTLALTNGALTIGAHTLTFNGPIATSAGGLVGGASSSIVFGGTGGATVLPAVQNGLNNLTIARAAGISLGADLTVVGTLALTSGDITTGASTLTMPAGAVSTGSSDVIGNVQRTGFVSGTTFSFGNPNNQITVTAGGPPTSILVNLVKSPPFATAVQRTYTITPTGGAGGITATLRLHYLVAELNGNVETSLNLFRYDGVSSWVPFPPTVPVDTTNHWVENNAVHSFSRWTLGTAAPTASLSTISGHILSANGQPIEGATVLLRGTQNRKSITDANGFYEFAEVETGGFYSVTPSRANFDFSPGQRSFSQIGERTEATFAGTFTGDSRNPLDTAEYFIRQQYVDILGREPDEGGFNYWTDRILECGTNSACMSARRKDIAAAFFVEAEFQRTGFYIYKAYESGLGRHPSFAEFSRDRGPLVAGENLENARRAFVENFVQQTEFVRKYQDATSDAAFVDAVLQNILQNSQLDLSSQRASLLNAYDAGATQTQSRAAVIQVIGENEHFVAAEYNPAFVLTEYFGYLRRDPDAGGYDFWLRILDGPGAGNFRSMVCAFITSAEYQHRFSSVVTRSNRDCGP